MKKIVPFLSVLISTLLWMGCGQSQENLESLAQRMAELDGVDMSEADEKLTADRIFRIKRLEDHIATVIESQNERAEFLKLLGLKYMDYRMWALAAESFDQAVLITPENSRLHYYRAVALAQQASSESAFSTRQGFFDAAEEDYKIALRLDPRYSSAAYGLSILYVFELNRPGEAEDLLDQLLQHNPSHTKGLLLRARLFEDSGNSARAAELYHRIIDLDRNSAAVETAESRLNILGGNR